MGNTNNEDKDLARRKKLIIDFMSEKQYKPMKFKELVFALSVKDEDKEELLNILNELQNEFKISKTKNGKYALGSPNIFEGTFVGNKKGFGFVEVEGMDSDFFIHERNSMNAFNGDKVLVKAIKKSADGKRAEAEVIRIISHEIKSVIGTFDKAEGYGFVIPDNKKIATDIFVAARDTKGAVSGHKVIVDITDYGSNNRSPQGKITEILGHINDPGADILTVVRTHDLPTDFPEEVMDYLERIPECVSEEEISGRKDMRQLDTVTIDGEDAKDLDDAITLSYENGIYHLGVHIADVTNYVTEKSPLDKEAFLRGTSVYLIDKVIPMLPHKLSNGICSLNAGVDRLCLSCLMDIDETGKIISHEICEGVINVNERMNYSDVAKILEETEDAPVERYKELVPMFFLMAKLSNLLRMNRHKRGSIDFDFPEAKIILDENKKPVEIAQHERNVATKLIEDFMLAANETVAEDYFWQELPFEYRTHDVPDTEKIEQLSYFLRGFGLSLKITRDKFHPMEFQKLLTRIEGEPYEAMVSKMTLRSMKQARYSTECTGHFGLGCKYYCHFTSPIRRYPDLQIHRIIKENLHGKLNEDRIKHYSAILGKVSDDNSKKERRAEEAERDVVKLKEIEYMAERIGEVYEGVISGFTSMNIFVELPNTVEGAVNVAYLHDDYYYYDESKYAMIGERKKKKYLLGDKVFIQVMKCDKINRTIDFKLLDELDVKYYKERIQKDGEGKDEQTDC